MRDAVKLAEYVRDMGFNPEQVQDFYPSPGSLATAMYATGVDPRTMKKVYVPRSAHEKALQRALIQYRNPANRDLVREALRRAHRTDLIGYGEKCLVRPEKKGERPAGEGEKRAKRGVAGEKNRLRDQRKASPNRKNRGLARTANGHKGGIRKGR